MRNFGRFLSLLLSLALIVSSFTLFAVVEVSGDGPVKLTIDASTVTGTVGNGSSEGLAQAVDGNKNTKYLTATVPAEIIFALTESSVVNYYEITSADHGEWDPKAWTLSGSADGETWTVIDTRSGEDFILTPDTNGYEFENEDAYLWYKLEVTESHGEAFGFCVAVSEIELYYGAPAEEEIEGIVVDLTSVTGTPGNGSSEGLVQAFDGSEDTKYLTATLPAEIIFSLKKAAVVNQYSLTSTDHGEWDPKAWTLYGSEDGEFWTELDAREDVDFTGREVTNTYWFDNEDEYLWYKLEVTESHGTVYGFSLAIAELTLAYGAEPDMTISVDASTVTGTPGNGSSEGLAQMFDGNVGTKYLTPTVPAEIVFSLNRPAVINLYKLTSTDHGEWDPKAWTLSGSEDGSSWTVIDERSAQDFDGRQSTNSYFFQNAAEYQWYKLEVTESHGEAFGFSIAIAEMEVYNVSVETDSIEGSAGDGSNTYYNLFDGSADTKYLVFRDSDSDVVEVSFMLTEPVVVNAYKLTSANDADARDPKDWTLYGSEDGEFWTELDAREDEDLPARKTAYLFEIPEENVDEYQWFKFEFTANNGTDPWGYNIIQLAEIELLYVEGEIVDENITVLTDTITCSTPYNDSHTADKLFDNDTGSKYLTNGKTMFVAFSLKSAKAINAYTIVCANDWASRNPSDWTFYGSVDGENWVKLDERSGETPVALKEGVRYVFENDTAYQWYKLDVTNNGGNAITGFAELILEVTEDPAVYATQLAIDPSSVTAPSGTSGNGVGNLTDNDRTTRYLVQNNGASFNIDFQLVKPGVVNRYAITGSKDHLERSPKTFSFYGSVDGETWELLDSQDLASKSSSDPNYFCGNAFSFENNVVYKYYRLTVEAVSSGSYTGFGEFSVFTEYTPDGLDLYAPANVTDLTGVAAAAKLNSIVIKALVIDEDSAAAIDAAGPVTVYGHKTEEEGLDLCFEGMTNVTFVNLLAVEYGVSSVKADKNVFTAVGAIKAPDLEYSNFDMIFTFYQGGEIVKEKAASEKSYIRSVYTTITNYATVKADIAAANDYELIDAAYLMAVSVNGIPEGDYTVVIRLIATVIDQNGSPVEVVSDEYQCDFTV